MIPPRRGHDGFAPLPRGARDLLPGAQRRRRALTNRLLALFDRWGYEAVSTPAVEYFDVFGRGLAERERSRCIRFISPDTGELVTLRSDVTPQIARLAGQRLGDRLRAGESLRLAYAADVVRLPDGPQGEAEHHQVGVELLGEPSPAADAELLALADAALAAVGLDAWHFDLAHVGVAREVLDGLGLAQRARDELILRLGRKDESGIAALLSELDVAVEARRRVLALSGLYGEPSILGRARELLALPAVHAALDELEGVVAGVRGLSPAAAGRISIDLGEVRGFDYYSGLRLRVWAPGSPRPLILGGRYDHLVGHYGVDAPATGFAVEVEALEAALPVSEVDDEMLPTSTLVAVSPAADGEARLLAARLAQSAREAGERAWIQLRLDGAAAELVAERAGATRLINVAMDDAGRPRTTTRCRRSGRWQHERDVE